MNDVASDETPLCDPVLVAACLAIDAPAIGGVALRCRPGPVRDRWMKLLRLLLPDTAPVKRLPLNTADGRMLGGLDLAATLRAGRPVADRGLLAEADGGILVLAMAERVSAATAARLTSVLDSHEVVLERDGIAERIPTRLGIIALDEGIEDERLHPALMDRLAFHVDLDAFDPIESMVDRARIEAARAHFPHVACDDGILSRLAETALALGIGSSRADLLAARVTRMAAALAGRRQASEADAMMAARLVLAPRATRLPALEQTGDASPPPPAPEGDREGGEASSPPESGEPGEMAQDQPPADMVVAAACAAIPAGLLKQLQSGPQRRAGSLPAGKAGAWQVSMKRGRPAGIRRGDPRRARLNLIETLRAAAPWQKLRRRPCADGATRHRIEIRTEDFRITRYKQRSETTTLFVVDASGSLALNRLAEAKGAVELLLIDCYVRRDQVALVVFRGKGAELLLPPTRSLARAKRSLASLPGGGASPLATAIDMAVGLGDQISRRGQTPVIVFLTDGRANVARDGSSGRQRAEDDAIAAARAMRLTGIRTLVVDAAQRPQPPAQRLAQEMGAIYLPLPHANASALSDAVRAAAP